MAKAEDATSTTAIMDASLADPHGFLEVAKVEAAKRPVDERVGDWKEVYELQDPHQRAGEVSQQARRCMDCGIPFATPDRGLSARKPHPGMNDLVRAVAGTPPVIACTPPITFLKFTGRLCPAPCETACVLSIAEEQTGGSVTIKRIEQTIVDQAWMDASSNPAAAISTGKRGRRRRLGARGTGCRPTADHQGRPSAADPSVATR